MPDRKNSKVEDEKCNKYCNVYHEYAGCDGPETCCGGTNAYSVRENGNANVGKGILSRIATRVNSDDLLQQEFGKDYDAYASRYAQAWTHMCDGIDWLKYDTWLCLKVPGMESVPNIDHGPCDRKGGFYGGRDSCIKLPGIQPYKCVDNLVNCVGASLFFVKYIPPFFAKARCCAMKFDIKIVVNAMLATSDGKELKQYSMFASDTTPSSDSYKEEPISGAVNQFKMVGTKLDLEDLTETDVSQPVKIENFTPVKCAANSECENIFTVTFKEESTLTIGAGVDLSMTVGSEISTTVGGEIPFGPSVEATASLKTEFTASASMNVENSKTQGKEISDTTRVLVKLEKDESATIDLVRRTQDTVYGWTCTFALEGNFQLTTFFSEHKFDISTFLADRQFYTYGKWTYPDSDIIEVLITTSGGRSVSCGDHKAGVNTTCEE